MNVFNKLKDTVSAYVGSDVEKKIIEATSTEPWGCSNTLKNEIADYTYSHEHYEEAATLIWKRLDSDSSVAVIISKTLDLIEYLLKSASDRFVSEIKRQLYFISKFERFSYNDGERDYSRAIRECAKRISALARDDDELSRIRDEFRSSRQQSGSKYGSSSSGYGGYGSSTNRYSHQSSNYGHASRGYDRDNDRYGGGHTTNSRSTNWDHDNSRRDTFQDDPYTNSNYQTSQASRQTTTSTTSTTTAAPRQSVATNAKAPAQSSLTRTTPTTVTAGGRGRTIGNATTAAAATRGRSDSSKPSPALRQPSVPAQQVQTTPQQQPQQQQEQADPFASVAAGNHDPFNTDNDEFESAFDTIATQTTQQQQQQQAPPPANDPNDPFALLATQNTSSQPQTSKNDLLALYNQPQQQQQPMHGGMGYGAGFSPQQQQAYGMQMQGGYHPQQQQQSMAPTAFGTQYSYNQPASQQPPQQQGFGQQQHTGGGNVDMFAFMASSSQQQQPQQQQNSAFDFISASSTTTGGGALHQQPQAKHNDLWDLTDLNDSVPKANQSKPNTTTNTASNDPFSFL